MPVFFPCGFQTKACLVTLLVCFRWVCPIHIRFLLVISLLMVCWSVLLHISSWLFYKVQFVFHSVGTFSCSQIFRNRWCNTYVVVIGSAFRASGGMPSGHGVFPSFNNFSALLISPFEGGFVITLNNISAIGRSGLSAGGSLLRICLKVFFPILIFSLLPCLRFFLTCLSLVLKDFFFSR